jgi:tRNA (guanine-N7-)-methyltransferase
MLNRLQDRIPTCQLPVHHPDFHYVPSKNPYWKKLHELKGLVFSDQDTEVHAGKWQSQYESQQTHSPQSNNQDPSAQPSTSPLNLERELHVEIGCNGGHVIVEWAAAQPNKSFVGIDWKFKPIFKGAEKSIRRNLKNIKFFRAHAERLQFMFGPEEVSHLYLFFPDPWPKKAHWKNRFITAERLREIVKIMKPGGVFHIKTDHPGYFEWMLEAVAQVGDIWETTEMTRNLHQNNPAPHLLRIPEITLFEGLFIKDGIPIQSMKLIKK